jgi:hypothetical protein
MTGRATTVSVRVAFPVPALFTACSEIVETPAAVGVPEIKPVVPFTERPLGSPTALKLVGLLVAVI